MAAPAWQAQGAIEKGGGTVTPAWPAHITDDVALLFVETANEAATLSVAAGFVEITNSPQGTGTGGTSGATRLTVFWARATSAAMASPTVADSGDHQIAVIVTFRGCIATGNPWDVTAGSTAASSTSVFIPTVTTTVAETLVVLAVTNNGTVDTTQVTTVPLNAALVGITKRLDSQPVLPALGASQLRFGPYSGMNNRIGAGPSGNGLGAHLAYTLGGINPHSVLSTLEAHIQAADALDLTIFATTPDSPSNFGANSATGFDFVRYKAKIDILAALPYFVAGVQSGRIVCVIADEPNHTKWDDSTGANTFSPLQLDACAAYHKLKFGPNCMTVARVDCHRLRIGWKKWVGASPAAYVSLDYGVYQYEGPGAQAHQTVLNAWLADVTDGTAVNVGCIPSLNIWAGGNHIDSDGVAACWDHAGIDGTSSGVIAGGVQGTTFALGQHIECATWTGTATALKRTLVASPDWQRRVFDVFSARADVPWLLYWTWVDSSLGSTYTAFNPLQIRADFIAAGEYGVTKCASRATANALRTPKAS